MLYQEQNVIQI